MSNTKPIGNRSKTKRLLLVIMLCSVTLMACLPTSLSALGATEYAYVYGYVVDAEGNALEDVTVSIVKSDDVIASAYTDTSGYFMSTGVEYGMYTISLEKSGYVSVSTSVTLQDVYFNLGTTVMDNALSLSSSTSSIIVNPGDQLTLSFTARNSGEETEVVKFSVSNPSSWSAILLEQSYEIVKVNLDAGQSMSLQLQVTVPSTATVNQDYNVTVNATSTTSNSLTFTIMVRDKLTAVVSGKVVDENNGGIQDVTVGAYSSDGSLIQSVSTTSTGEFNIELPIDTDVSLHFSKDGYVEVTKTVTMNYANEQLVLSNIVLTKVLTIQSSILNMVANPGEQLELSFVVTNNGEDAETVTFSVSSPSGWSVCVLGQNSREVKTVVLSSGASSSFQLDVTVPMNSNGDANLALTATGTIASTLDFVVTVEQTSDSILSCQFPGKWTLRGDPVSFQVTLTNLFGSEMRYAVSIESVPSDWTAHITASGDYVTEIILDVGESVTLMIDVETSSSSSTTETYELLVVAESTDQIVTDSLLLAVALNEPETSDEIKVTTKFPEVTVEAGEAVKYSITVSNLGDTNRLLYLSITAPDDWKAVIQSGTLEITQIDIDAGSSESLTIEVTPPSTVTLGSYNVSFYIKSESGSVLTETGLKATIVGSYGLSLESSTLLTSTTSGSSTSFTVTVTNAGYSYVTGVSLAFDVEDDWDVTISPVQVEMLKPEESCTFDVVVDTPEGTVSGDYMVTLLASSDQSESSQSQVRVTVSASTEWGIYGLAVAVILIVVLVLVFRKFKRR